MTSRRTKQNILLITFDQWRGDWMGDKIHLPVLLELEKSGKKYTRCYTPSPHCMPARFSILTGLHPSQMKVTENTRASIHEDAPSFARDLGANGWRTIVIGKTHFKSHDKPGNLNDDTKYLSKLGFSESIEIAGPRGLRRMECKLTNDWAERGYLEKQREDLEKRYKQGTRAEAFEVRATVLPLDLYPDIWIKNQALKKVETLQAEKPWFMWVSFVGPHEPFDTPYPWKGQTAKKDLPQLKKKCKWMHTINTNTNIHKNHKKWKKIIETIDLERCRMDYIDHLKLLDEQLGDIIGELKERGLYENTKIIITADHGEMMGDYEMMYKGTFLEPSIKVPMIVIDNHNKGKKGKKERKPTMASQVIHQEIEACTTNTKPKSIKESKDYVCIEYKDELCLHYGRKKIVGNIKNEEIIWAATSRDRRLRANENEMKLIRIDLRHELAKRKRRSWVWRDLKC